MDSPLKSLSRRGFLQTAVGAGAATSLVGCSKRLPRYLVPDTVPPEDTVPGVSRYYRTICRECPSECGVVARVREGRAVKVEGNPHHPLSNGALCLRGQAAIESLYAPDRLGAPLLAATGGQVETTWDKAEDALVAGLRAAKAANQRVVIVTRPERGLLGDLFRTWLTAFGQDTRQVATFDPMEPSWIREGARRAFGIDQQPIWNIGRARTLLAVGADFLEDWGSPVEHARALAQLRAAGGRFVYVGPRLSLTAAAADEWLAPVPGTEGEVVLALARAALEGTGAEVVGLSAETRGRLRTTLGAYDLDGVAARTGLARASLGRLVEGFLGSRPSLCVGPGRAVAGADAAPLAETVHLLNALAGNLNETVHFAPAADAAWAAPAMSLDEVAALAAKGEIGALLVHHANPLGFGAVFGKLAAALERVPTIAAFTNHRDETARRAHVVLPDHHFLEAWGDASPRPGVRGLQQPVMTPLRPTRAAGTVLLEVARKLELSGLPDGDFDQVVRQAAAPADLERGGVFGEPTYGAPTLAEDVLQQPPRPARAGETANALTLIPAPTIRYLDGQHPRSDLLQEIPDPLTTIAWSGWVEIHPQAAARLGVATGDLLQLTIGAARTELPVFVHPGLREEVVAVPVPYATALLAATGGQITAAARVQLQATGRKTTLAVTGGSLSQQGRGLAQEVFGTSDLPPRHPAPTMYDAAVHPAHRWGLAIDIDKCTGCGACAGACYVENNTAIVGAEEVAGGRDMGWLHVQRYFEGPSSHPRALFQPTMCQHCSNAPCESVCPVFATYHSHDGLNVQVYNRCVGTRYCDNNCPYSVRRFNWYDHAHPEPSNLGLNPDVTVRERGVIEKCSLCVHRIRAAEEQARVDGRVLREGDVEPACVQTCPSQAIVFGDLKDPASRISRAATDKRGYRLLEELNTRPGVVYLARRREEGSS